MADTMRSGFVLWAEAKARDFLAWDIERRRLALQMRCIGMPSPSWWETNNRRAARLQREGLVPRGVR